MVRTQNIFERKVIEDMESKGYEVLKSGWPDFVLVNWETKEIRFVEVKPGKKRLKPRQVKMQIIFKMLGLNYEVCNVHIDEDGSTTMKFS